MKNHNTKIKALFAATLLFAAVNTNAQTWNTTGNAGTDPATNFVGTTDAKALRIRTNNQSRMTITSGGNVGIGTTAPAAKLDVNGQIKITGGAPAAGKVLTSDSSGLASWQAPKTLANGGFEGAVPYWDGLQWMTNDSSIINWKAYNAIALGRTGGTVYIGNPLNYYYDGSRLQMEGNARINDVSIGKGGHSVLSNTSLGVDAALFNNSQASQNTAVGYFALRHNASGSSNTAVGYQALYNTDFYSCTAVGANALSGGTGVGCTAVGESALRFNTNGYMSSAFGASALYSNTTGDRNTALGSSAMKYNKTGNYNTAAGHMALYADTSGSDNAAYGYTSMRYLTKGDGNSAFGHHSLYCNVIGSQNVALGNYAGAGSSGINFENCTFIGAWSYATVARTNVTMLGYGIANAQCTGNNQVLLGNTSVNQIRAQVTGITAYSDGRYKTNVKKDVKGLDFINLLNPVSYNVKPTELHKIWGTPDSLVKLIDHSETEKVRYTGFLAQDVEKAMRESGYDFTGIDIPKNDHENYALRYTEFIMPLVKAVQELDTKNNALAEENAQLKKDIAEIKAALNIKSTESNVAEAQLSNSKITVSPNPFNENTTVSFELSKEIATASIKILSLDGRQLKSIAVNDRGNVTMNISANELSSGTYIIQIVADGKIMGSQKISCVK